jgi:hypothetical protein
MQSFSFTFYFPSLALFDNFLNNLKMVENSPEILAQFGKRVQRCYGCFVAYHLKDMYLGEDVTFFCEHCKDETMFHFDDFSKLMDLSKLKEVSENDHHH